MTDIRKWMIHQKSIKHLVLPGTKMSTVPRSFKKHPVVWGIFFGAEDTIGIDAALSKVHQTYLRPDSISSELRELVLPP